MDNQQISNLAAHIRASSGKSNVFTISTNMLSYLLTAFEAIEEQSTSFNIKTSHNYKAELLRDLQFLQNFFQQTKTLKLYGDNDEDNLNIDITKFKNLYSVEFYKVNLNSVKGLQVLRSQLLKLICQKTSNSLAEVLSNCGKDKSQSYCWNELKEVTFVSNGISELDQSLECVPWLHTLDLSHNELKNVEALNCLPNLKHLNLSYNRLESVPVLKGQICSRLQNLILKNNFIEDVAGLRLLTNLSVLDLAGNCLLDHRSLLPLSHLATLQWLNLQDNPLSFHPHHRNRVSNYLHLNTSSTQFVLDRSPLTRSEKKLTGSFHQPRTTVSLVDGSTPPGEKPRRVRHVVIEEEAVVVVHTPKLSASPQRHLETKKQIEDLHDRFGESWLNSQSGLLVQNVLGLEGGGGQQLSTSPYQADFSAYSGDFAEEAEEPRVPEDDAVSEEAEPQDLEEVEVEGEESIYLATVKGELEPVFVVVGRTHFCERECSTGDERARWHVDSIASCDGDGDEVQVRFETMRRDRKGRVYVFEEEMEAFLACVKNKINSRLPKQVKEKRYQCMRCSSVFGGRKESILGEAAVKCPSCDSNLVVEEQ